jgi:AsmA-like protein
MLGFRYTRKLVWAGLVLLLAGLLAPVLVRVNFLHGKISSALSKELGRGVRTGAIHLKLFGGPGFEIDNVAIEEDPRFGVEPMARMETLRATLGLSSFWKYRMEFRSLVFVNPSLNLVQNAAGRWNVESLWSAAPDSATSSSSGLPSAAKLARADEFFERLPKIEIDSGRINFKSEDRKKVFLIDSLEMEITPPRSATEPWRLSFEGRPNRTDFALNPVSRFRGRAEFGPSSPALQTETGTLAHLDLTTENALVDDLLKVFSGNDHGVHGTLNMNLHLAGTTSLLRVSGSADLRDLHRWDRLPPASAPVLHADIAALLDLERESLEIRSVSMPLSQGSVVVDGEVEQLLHRPRADLEARLRSVPLAGLAEIGKQFTSHLDSRFTAQGTLNGRVQMEGTLDSLTGNVAVTRGAVEEKGTPQSARLSDFNIVFDGASGKAGPATVSLGERAKLGVSLEWDLRQRSLTTHLEGDGIPMISLLPWTRTLGTRWGQADFSKGDLDLRLNVSSAAGQSAVTGWAQISDAVLNSNSVNELIPIPLARLEFQPQKVTVKPFSAEIGGLELHGSLVAKLSPPGSAPSSRAGHFPAIEFDCRASRISLAELDRALNPRYRARPLFGLGKSSDSGPSFFSGLVAQGTLTASSFQVRSGVIRNFKASIEYHDKTLELNNFSGEFSGGTQNGKAAIRFGLGAPDFSLESRFSNVDLAQLTKESPAWSGFFSGKLGGQLRLAGAGWDLAEILDHLGGSGEVTGSNLELDGIDLARGESSLAPVTRINSLSAAFQIAKKEVILRDLKLVPAVRPARGETKPVLVVTGTVGFDRTLDLMVADKVGTQQFHWSGTLAEPRVGETAASLHAGAEEPAH